MIPSRGRKNSGLKQRPSMFSDYSFLKCWGWNPGASYMLRKFYHWATTSGQANFYPEFPLSYDHFYHIYNILQKSNLTWAIHLLRATFLRMYVLKFIYACIYFLIWELMCVCLCVCVPIVFMCTVCTHKPTEAGTRVPGGREWPCGY